MSFYINELKNIVESSGGNTLEYKLPRYIPHQYQILSNDVNLMQSFITIHT